MNDLKLTIKIGFDGRNEIEKLINQIGQKHNLKIDSNLGELNAEIINIDKSLNGIFKKFQYNFSQFGFLLAGISQSLNLVKNTIGESVNLAREDLRAFKLIENTLQATGNTAKYTALELKKMAGELQNITNFGDDEILAKVTNPLLTFRNLSGQVFKEAQVMVLDMATSLGMDLQSAAMQLGKALQDPIEGVTALSRVGVRLTEEQKELIKSFMEVGDHANAQGVILKELKNQFGGLATGTIDPITQLNNAFNDFREGIGLMLLPAISSVSIGLKTAIETMTFTQVKFEQFKGIVIEIGKAVAILTSSLVVYIGIIKMTAIRNSMVIASKIQLVQATNLLTVAKMRLIAITKAYFTLVTGHPFAMLAVAIGLAVTAVMMYDKQKKEATKSILDFYHAAQLENKINEVINDKYREGIELLKTKQNVGVETHEQLMQAYDLHIEFLENTYGKESKLYYNALDEKTSYHKQYVEKQKAEEQKLADEKKQIQDNELKSLQDTIDLLTIKRQNGVDTIDSLKKAHLDYAKRIKEIYTEDSIEYQKALLNKSNFLKEFLQKSETEIRDEKNKSLQQNIALLERKYALEIANLEDLKNAIFEYEQYVQESETDAYLTMLEKKQSFNKEVQRLTDERTRVEEDAKIKSIEIAQEKWEFENAQLSIIDPELARNKARLNSIDQYYEKRRQMLIDAGIEETKIDDQIAQEKLQIEQAYQMARLSTISNGMGKILGDIAKSGVVSFEVSKALQIAQLLIETPAAAFASYRAVAGIPIVGPTLAPIAFATAMSTGMAQIANIKKQKPPKAEKGGLSGLLMGASHSQGGIIIEAEGNEYITNKKRVAELGKGFFDFINFAPLESVKKALLNINLPKLNVPTMPNFAYATGGMVASRNNDFRPLEGQFEKMIDKLDKIEQKDYNINIKSSISGVKFHREVKNAENIYNRKMK